MGDIEFEITQFVRGMAWHDIGKPFHLGTSGHIWLGYWLLARAGYEGEALVALTHGGGRWSGGLRNVLEPYFDQGGEDLPAALLLSNSVDQIAASFYSLLGRRIDLKEYGKRNPLYHSWQNPFSRLPVHSEQLPTCDDRIKRRFIVLEEEQGSREPRLDEPLRKRLVESLPPEWKKHIRREDLDEAVEDKCWDRKTARPQFALGAQRAEAEGRALLKKVEKFLAHYPERTYPPANDTTLMEHNRLGAALAFVLYRNLERDASGAWWLSSRIWRSDEKYFLGTKGGEAREVYTYLHPGEILSWNDARRVACAHLDARLVRVAFEGLRDLFEGAVRVDDLLGARALTQRFLDAFEEELAEVLRVPGSIWESEEDDRRCLLTLHRSQFDLFYLLPPHPGEPGMDKTIEETVDEAYEQALERIVGELVEELEKDFRRAVDAGKLAFGAEEARALGEQLRALGYRLRVLDAEVPGVNEVDTFADFTSKYGRALVEKFSESQGYATVPASQMPTGLEPESGEEALPADETCDVCGNHRVLEPFAALLEDEEWGPYVQKAIHHFRGEPERPCISCIGRRILAHGAVAEETEHVLQQMVRWEHPEAERPRVLVAVEPEGGLSLPLAMLSRVELKGEDPFVDLGAAFARYRRTDGQVRYDLPPQVFPTVSYAADRMGNVVLLTLQPGREALHDEYSYARAVDKEECGDLPQEIRSVERLPETDWERWLASFVALYRWQWDKEEPERKKQEAEKGKADKNKSAAYNMIHVRPHLARVMERIRRVRAFYRDLKEALERVPLRVLPLDVGYPTLRLLVPADQLDVALEELDRVVTESLFSATYLKDEEGGKAPHELLKLLVPPNLLHGAVVLFKQKFPLYLALEAERSLLHHLARTDGGEEAYGLRLAFTDLRGTLSEARPELAQTSYADLGRVLDLAGAVDRRTVLLRARFLGPEVKGKEDARWDLADAVTVIRGDRARLEPGKVDALEEEHVFPAVLFVKRAVRR